MQLPVTMAYDHGHGRVSEAQEYMPSTGTTLGAITLPYAFPNPEQELRRRVADWKRTLDHDAHGRVEVGQDYYLDIYLDEDRPLRFDEEGVRTLDGQPAVQAAISRPLRGDPYLTVETLMCSPSAFEPNGECMVRLLMGAKREGQLAFGSREEVEAALDESCHGSEEEIRQDDWREEGVSTALAMQVCRAHGLALQVWWRGAKVAEVPGKDPVRYVIRGDHAYELAKPPRALREPRHVPETAIAQDFAHAEQGAPTEVVQQVPEGLVAGTAYRATDLDAIRERLHSKWIVPDCKLSGPNSVVQLSVPREGGVATVHLLKEDLGAEAFCTALASKIGRPFPYRGETQELLSLRALNELTRGRRDCRTSTVKSLKCGLCGDPAQELDHAVRLADGGSNDPSNLQPLCAECHHAKSTAERQSSLGDCFLRSRLNRETYAQFHESKKPPQMVQVFREVPHPVCMVDVKRCRFNGLAKLTGTLPIFSPLDSVVPAEAGKLGDYNWVEACHARSDLMALPWWGPGWYGERTCRYLLSHGIIHWDHIALHFTASAHVPCDYLASRLEILDQCWGERAKGALNAMLGLMGKVEHFKYHLVTSTEERDVVTSLPVTRRRAPGSEELQDFIVKQRKLTYATWRPIHQLCLESERLQMARACYVIRRLAKPEAILSFHVDAVYFESRSARLRKVLSELSHPDLPHLKEFFDFERPYSPAGGEPVFKVHTEARQKTQTFMTGSAHRVAQIRATSVRHLWKARASGDRSALTSAPSRGRVPRGGDCHDIHPPGSPWTAWSRWARGGPSSWTLPRAMGRACSWARCVSALRATRSRCWRPPTWRPGTWAAPRCTGTSWTGSARTGSSSTSTPCSPRTSAPPWSTSAARSSSSGTGCSCRPW